MNLLYKRVASNFLAHCKTEPFAPRNKAIEILLKPV